MTELTFRSANFEPETYSTERRTVEAIISSGADVLRKDHLGEYIERLPPAKFSLPAGRARVPLLRDHQRTLDSVIGFASNLRSENGREEMTFQLSDRPELGGLRKDIQDGFIDSVSIGYQVPKWKEYSESGTRVKEAVEVVIHEVSFVPLPADAGAKTRSEVTTMTEELQTQIRGIAVAVGVPDGFTDSLIHRNLSIDDARRELILEASRRTPRIDSRSEIVRDSGDGLISRLADGLLSRVNPQHKPSTGREYAHFRIAELAKECLKFRGLSTLGSGVELVTRALHTSSDFPAVLAEVFNKSLLLLAGSDRSPLEAIFKRATVSDFRNRHIMEIGDGPSLEKVNEGGEIKWGSIADKELSSYHIDSYGKAFGISFKSLINDDLAALSDLSAKMSRGARSWFAGFLADTLISNPKLADNKAVFHADHSNLAATGAAPSETTIAAAKLAMRLQVDLSGNPLNLSPRYIVIPAALETAVDKLLAELYPQSSSAAEVAVRGLTPIVESRFDSKGEVTDWYLFCDPATAPLFEYAELEGYNGPQVEVRQGFEHLGSEGRVVWHVGSGAIDSRGGFRNPGA